MNLPDNKYKCLSCPAGFEDSDGGCVDINECERFSPCFAELNVTCTNTVSIRLSRDSIRLSCNVIINLFKVLRKLICCYGNHIFVSILTIMLLL